MFSYFRKLIALYIINTNLQIFINYLLKIIHRLINIVNFICLLKNNLFKKNMFSTSIDKTME